ncbi:MAG TPA: hypothetical protein VEC12_04200 [Bacteroidia bacterium]|nr:hypothetical protein [Bacteroidia bacterium]
MERKHCGTITFYNHKFDVHWDAETKKVYISKLNNPELSFIHYSDFKADTPEEAPTVAAQLLQTVLGKE